jgi:hypothetical protein
MSIERLRGLGKQGVLADPDPYDLPIDAFNAGVNVRFRNSKITSGPVFRSAIAPMNLSNPRFLFTSAPTQGSNLLFLGYQSGNVHLYNNGSELDYTLAGYTTSAVEATWSGTTLDGIVYINRSDRTPWYLPTGGSAFANLAVTAPPGGLTTNAPTSTSSNVLSFPSVPAGQVVLGMSVYNSSGVLVGFAASATSTTVILQANAFVAVASGATLTFSGQWDPTWSTRILRQCAGALVALNVTKGATNYPQLVKTSSIVSFGSTPASWDIAQPSTLATENTLGSMDGGITDGCPLGQDLIIYGLREAWRMHADGSTFVYNYTKLPFRKGSINANCTFELDGKNFVFGLDDIWVHDGVSEKSLCDQQVRDFIYNALNVAQASKCFVAYNSQLNEMYFAYVSGDAYVNFLNNVNGCNRQATLNLTTNTWTFDDLPSVFSAANGPLANILTYATVTTTYTTMGGSYQDQEDGGKRVMAYTGESVSGYSLSTSLYAFDLYGTGSIAAFGVDTNATAPRYLERIGISLDELNEELRGYKAVNSVYPQARVDTSGGNYLQFSIGASDYINSSVPTWQPYQNYDGVTKYKLDFNAAGRWLALRVKWNDYRTFTLTGFDLDIQITGRR